MKVHSAAPASGCHPGPLVARPGSVATLSIFCILEGFVKSLQLQLLQELLSDPPVEESVVMVSKGSFFPEMIAFVKGLQRSCKASRVPCARHRGSR